MQNLGVAMVGGHGKRRADDFYPTPPEATLALLPLIAHWPRHVWEPACGDGAIARELESAGYKVAATDLIDRGFGESGVDFLKTTKARRPTVVTNPPFKLAGQFIEHAHEIGVLRMALLLKMTFWNAATRRKVWDRWPPSALHPLTWRLDFDGRGAPTMDCMWCLWEPHALGTTFKPLPRPIAPTMSETESMLA